MSELLFLKPEEKKLAEEILGFSIPGKYVTLSTLDEINWLYDRIKERQISRKLNPKNVVPIW